MQQTSREVQVGGFAVLCSFSNSLKACQAISTFCSQMLFCPYLQRDQRKNQGQSSRSKAQSHMVIQQPHEKTLIPDLPASLPCTHFEQWLSTACLNRYSAVGLYRSNCLLIIHYTLWNTVLKKKRKDLWGHFCFLTEQPGPEISCWFQLSLSVLIVPHFRREVRVGCGDRLPPHSSHKQLAEIRRLLWRCVGITLRPDSLRVAHLDSSFIL